MRIIYLLPLLMLLVTACSKDTPDQQPVDLTVKLSYAAQEFNGRLDLTDVKVQVKNLSNNVLAEYQAKNGSLLLENLAAGQYDIVASITFSKDRFNELTGGDSQEEVTFNASLSKVSLLASQVVEMQLMAGKMGEFVIKQIYYAGSDNKDGALFRDQFFEIHNNSDRVLYADSLYFGRLWGRQSMARQVEYYLPNNQFDWSKAEGMKMGGEANTDYVYFRDLFMIPGNGKTYPVQPGKSIVIAQNALNHKVPFVGNNGKEVSVRNPDLTVDLSKADFEVYYGDIPGHKIFASDIDNPSVPNVEILEYTGNDWILDNLGRDAYAIFKTSYRVAVDALGKYAQPSIAKPSADAKKYKQVPVKWLEDVVEVQPHINDNRIPKKVSASQDAGFTFVNLGAYSSQSVIRKSVVSSGKLQDTNNSTEDFVVIKANPYGFAN
ncbi:DUF4876 domain-containing protein [Sphingobacterium sp. UT-1RO-CII-1]|uniref:DUF4876 domain-containing protein n=1 Tax=Sphingobacterium sp. UT-1RO-CII-1 TaxID=2995225 RepID=UPI00227AD8AF|nr:DUF4876 domain-containing protein [Sphingobacterium sp. UT-1RO-CII-1]MCY4780765.1 DUF4876 domain-containing protein [Sphingobacterium sp. UT-1RO-CII-1]